MNETAFRLRARELEYGDIDYKDYPPEVDGPLHTHDFSVMLLVVSGEFSIVGADKTTTYAPGQVCELAAQVPHAERVGERGARVLLGKRPERVS